MAKGTSIRMLMMIEIGSRSRRTKCDGYRFRHFNGDIPASRENSCDK